MFTIAAGSGVLECGGLRRRGLRHGDSAGMASRGQASPGPGLPPPRGRCSARSARQLGGRSRGGWYIDLIAIEEAGPDRLVVHDLYVDLIILPASRRYEVLDLDELADAVTTGVVDLPTATTVLRNTQTFINSHLANFDVEAPTTWPDFPPATIEALVTLPPFSTR